MRKARVQKFQEMSTVEGWIHGFYATSGKVLAVFENGGGVIHIINPSNDEIQFLEPPELLAVDNTPKEHKCPPGRPCCPTDLDYAELSCYECRKRHA